MAAPATLLSSSVGKKIVMAITGIVLSLFVLGHMAGNLQAFLQRARRRWTTTAPSSRSSAGTGIWFVRGGSSSRSGSTLGVSLAHAEELGRPPEGLRVTDFEAADLRLAHDALDGPDPRRLHRLPPPAHDDRQRPPALRRGRSTRTSSPASRPCPSLSSTSSRWAASRSTCGTGPGGCSRRSASRTRSTLRRARSSRSSSPILVAGGFVLVPLAVLAGRAEMNGTEVERPRRPPRERSGTSTAST